MIDWTIPLSIPIVAGVFLAPRYRWGFLVAMVAELLWAPYAWAMGQWGLCALCLIFSVLYLRLYKSRGAASTAPGVAGPLTPLGADTVQSQPPVSHRASGSFAHSVQPGQTICL